MIAVLARLHIERQRVNMGNIFSGCFSRVGRDAEAARNGEGVGGAASRLLGDSVQPAYGAAGSPSSRTTVPSISPVSHLSVDAASTTTSGSGSRSDDASPMDGIT